MRVGFVHPDLGLGGAERLVVDAAVGLQEKGHSVVMLTSHHDRSHCFKETRDGTLEVRVFGDWLPTRLFGAFKLIFAILRQLWLALRLLLAGETYDVLFIDQLSAGIPLLRWRARKILFYCHHPDKLLVTKGGRIKSLYRAPLDWLEEWTTGMSDTILANSRYTQSVFIESFPNLTVVPEILYPAINFSQYDLSRITPVKAGHPLVFLSINRFERKKNLPLAIQAFHQLLGGMKGKERENARLVMAGGYDINLPENVEHLQELVDLCDDLGLSHRIDRSGQDIVSLDRQVVFVPSFTEEQRTYLLQQSRCVVYTPDKEHFGIVPIEAMYCYRAVIAVNSGGPLESVLDRETGFLCPDTPQAFSQAMSHFITAPAAQLAKMGQVAHQHAESNYSLGAFTERLDGFLTQLMTQANGEHGTGSSAGKGKKNKNKKN